MTMFYWRSGFRFMSRNNMVQRGDIVDIFATFQQKVKTISETEVTATGGKRTEMRTFTVIPSKR
jgi:hypothetical protein